jgi:hypothetical protein
MTRKIIACLVVVFLVTACNRRVFRQVEASCDRTIPVDYEIEAERPADILIVVDNSGSMQEEQDELAKNFLNLNVDANGNPECPLTDLANVPDDLKNPTPDKFTGDGVLARCGFIQLLAAFDNNFQVGVITTDVGLIDNRQPGGQAARCFPDGSCAFGSDTCGDDQSCDDEWGQRPQRGCLQPDASGNKVITRADIDDPERNQLAQRFAQTLDNIRTFGSPIERGLDAAAVFLDKNAVRGEGCENDLQTFRREGAQLAVIFLSDEQDCSHGLGDPAFPEELAPELNGEELSPFVAYDSDTSKACYGRVNDLSPVALYRDAITAVDPQAKIALIGGIVEDDGENDGVAARGCIGSASGPVDACWGSGGLSNFNFNNATCSDTPSDAAVRDARDCTDENGTVSCALDCCLADAGSRYLDFARLFADERGKRYFVDSICKESFTETMLEVAAFLVATNFIDLVEPPADGLITVEINDEQVPRIDASQCADTRGWYLEGTRRIVYCGSAIPRPGDRVSVRAKAASNSEDCL